MNKAVIDESACPSIKGGHPWIFSNKIRKIDILYENPLVYVYSEKGSFLCTAYYNPRTSIALRVLSRNKIKADQDFFYRRIGKSLSRRNNLGLNSFTDSYRIVHGESDLLPGLVVDKYNSQIVVQFHTSGMDFYKNLIIDSIIRLLAPKSIYEKSENASILLEGKPKKKCLLYGEEVKEDIIIRENGLKFAVDIINGQKTGFFLDQRDNRLFIRKFSKGLRILNLFSYTCSFGINALAGCADYVLNVDASRSAMEKGKVNQELNGFNSEKIDYITGNAFDFLENEHSEYDLIILDPPALIKGIKDIRKGTKAYCRLNTLAMSRLIKDGMLFTCSCSSFMSMEGFLKVLSQASMSLQLNLQILGCFGQPVDHPLLASFPEGHYLKGVFLRII